MYRIDVWNLRGIVTLEAPTKREANRLAGLARDARDVQQTVVTFPNGTARICRNVAFTGGK